MIIICTTGCNLPRCLSVHACRFPHSPRARAPSTVAVCCLSWAKWLLIRRMPNWILPYFYAVSLPWRSANKFHELIWTKFNFPILVLVNFPVVSHFARIKIAFAQNTEWQPSASSRSRVWSLGIRARMHYMPIYLRVCTRFVGLTWCATTRQMQFFAFCEHKFRSTDAASMWHPNFISLRLVCSQIEFSMIVMFGKVHTLADMELAWKLSKQHDVMSHHPKIFTWERANREHKTKKMYFLPFKANLGLRNTIFIRHSRGQIDRDESNDNWRFRLAEIVLHTDWAASTALPFKVNGTKPHAECGKEPISVPFIAKTTKQPIYVSGGSGGGGGACLQRQSLARQHIIIVFVFASALLDFVSFFSALPFHPRPRCA